MLLLTEGISYRFTTCVLLSQNQKPIQQVYTSVTETVLMLPVSTLDVKPQILEHKAHLSVYDCTSTRDMQS